MDEAIEGFDCVEMMHEGGLRIHEALKAKTREEQLTYWREREEEMRRKYPRMRELNHANPPAK